MCDIEGYIYLPLLEETGYIPKHKYSYGYEIREQIERVAHTAGVKGFFSTKVNSQVWDEERGEWVVNMTQYRGPGRPSHTLTVRTQFLILSSGVFTDPNLPALPGLDVFRKNKKVFHSSRWDYKYTGGTQEEPNFEHLKDKVVAIVGTGATAIQIVPAVAKYAKHLYVFQRTPTGCGPRGQQVTDVKKFAAEVATGKDWQRKRQTNFQTFVENWEKPAEVDLCNDGWTATRATAGLVGSTLR